MSELQGGAPVELSGTPGRHLDPIRVLLGHIGFGRSAAEITRTRRDIAAALALWLTTAVVAVQLYGTWFAVALCGWVIPCAVLVVGYTRLTASESDPSS